MTEVRVLVNDGLRSEFDQFLETLFDVMQLYYTGSIHWGEALKRIDTADRYLRERQAVLLKSFAEAVAHEG